MLTGSIVALVTPMHENGEVAWDALDELIEWQVASGTQGIVPMGTTGESATLDTQEHLQVIKRTIDQVAGRVPWTPYTTESMNIARGLMLKDLG